MIMYENESFEFIAQECCPINRWKSQNKKMLYLNNYLPKIHEIKTQNYYKHVYSANQTNKESPKTDISQNIKTL